MCAIGCPALHTNLIGNVLHVYASVALCRALAINLNQTLAHVLKQVMRALMAGLENFTAVEEYKEELVSTASYNNPQTAQTWAFATHQAQTIVAAVRTEAAACKSELCRTHQRFF